MIKWGFMWTQNLCLICIYILRNNAFQILIKLHFWLFFNRLPPVWKFFFRLPDVWAKPLPPTALLSIDAFYSSGAYQGLRAKALELSSSSDELSSDEASSGIDESETGRGWRSAQCFMMKLDGSALSSNSRCSFDRSFKHLDDSPI